MSKELMSRLKKNTSIQHANILSESNFFYNKKTTVTEVPIFNLACSGHLNKGFGAGITMFAGPSKHFKSNFGLMFVRSYLNQHKDSVCLYYDSEFGCTPEYLKSAGIDPERVLHLPITNIEDLKFDIVKQLQDIKKEENVIVFIDSVGNLASKKEVEDAINEKAVADMTRAKQLKSLWRMVTPYLTINDIPCIVINHTYETQEMFCLAGTTKIKTATGIKDIKDIEIGEYVYALNGLKEVINKFYPEDLPTENVSYMKLTFDDGSIVECTNTHKFLMKNGEWKRADEISFNDEFM